MKKWIKLIAMTMVLATFFVGCANTQSPNTNATESATSAPNTLPAEPRTLKIGDVDISQYKIVYAMNADKQAIMQSNDMPLKEYWDDAYDAEKQTALRLAEIIKTYLGVELDVGVDLSVVDSKYEILIGATNRSESQEAAEATTLSIDEYEIKLIGNRLVVRGGTHGAMYHALDALEEMLKTDENGRNHTITESKPIKGSYHLTRVAVIGDSISQGYSATNKEFNSYVPTTGRIHWKDHVVYNYGLTSTTMRSDLADSYQNSQQWADLRANTEKYDVVLIMLGTNDSNRIWKTGAAWGTADDTAYISSASVIIDTVLAHSPNAEIVIMSCPVYYGEKEFGSARVRTLQKSIADTLKSEDYKIHFFDMYSYTVEHLPREMLPDDLHPNNAGHYQMAKGVAAMLQALAEGKTSQYLLY